MQWLGSPHLEHQNVPTFVVQASPTMMHFLSSFAGYVGRAGLHGRWPDNRHLPSFASFKSCFSRIIGCNRTWPLEIRLVERSRPSTVVNGRNESPTIFAWEEGAETTLFQRQSRTSSARRGLRAQSQAPSVCHPNHCLRLIDLLALLLLVCLRHNVDGACGLVDIGVRYAYFASFPRVCF